MSTSPLAAPLVQEFMPHGMCYLWQSDLVWLHVVSDTLTTLAYWAIPFALLWFVHRARREVPPSENHGALPYDWMFVAFGVFIVACGATHAMGIWTIWEPRYWLEGGVKAVTAAASVATAIALPPLVPRAIDLLKEARESEDRRRQLEEAHLQLAEAHEELEEAHEELEELYEKVRDADRAKSEFLAAVSHELRTPITLVLGPAERGLEEPDTRDEDRERYAVIRRNAAQLSSRVDDLLQVARLETGDLEATYVKADAADLVRDVAEHFQRSAEDRDLDLLMDVPSTLPAEMDRAKTERVLFNLFSNAVKFTPAGGTVRCSLSADSVTDREREEELVVEVADSGPGVPDEAREEIFERFRQSSGGEERPHGGVGLGLSLARELTELQDGTLSVEDAPEGGALFRLRLPRRAPAGAVVEDRETSASHSWLARSGAAAKGALGAVAAEQDAPTEGVGEDTVDRDPSSRELPEILIVEDNRDLVRFLADSLRDDYRVRAARDGREGLEAVLTSPPDLVLTDLMMPRFGGERMIRELREDHGFHDLPVVVLTALHDDETAARLLRHGATDFVRKPVAVPELRARLANHLAVHQALEVIRRELDDPEAASRPDLLRMTGELAERKRALQEALRRNELLLQEVYHRVRGNLQLIESLLSLQIRRQEDPEARRALGRLRERISAMTLVHRILYRGDRPGEVDLAHFLQELVDVVFRSHRGEEQEITRQLDLEEIVVSAGDALACGIAVQELVSNSLQHGFPEGRRGRLEVTLRRDETGDVVLRVGDTGVGHDPGATDVDADRDPGGLGLEIVEALVRQLDGHMERSSREGSGTEVTISYTPDAAQREETA